jgi:small conductance mechanosensitive channel
MSPEQIKALIESITPLVTTWAIRIVGVLVLLWIAFRVARWAGDKVTDNLESKEFDVALSRFFGSLARWAIIASSVIGCLGMFGVETTSFAAIIGAAGLAIGLAFQGTLSNFAAGLMILVFRPFDIGDYIKAAGHEGVVAAIDLFTCAIDTLDNRRIVLPNSEVAGKTLENVTHHDVRRVDLSVGVAYNEDLAATRKALEGALKAIDKEDGAKGKDHAVVLIGLGDSSVNWQLRIWCKTGNYWAVYEQGLTKIKEALDEAKISIPFPNLEVHFMNALESAKS